jgi:hypothetical protein
VRDAFRKGFAVAVLPYFNPHAIRDTLVHHAMKQNFTPEEMKAWSQNLGHSDVPTTFTSYGTVPTHRQGELIRGMGADRDADMLDDTDIFALIRRSGRAADSPLFAAETRMASLTTHFSAATSTDVQSVPY